MPDPQERRAAGVRCLLRYQGRVTVPVRPGMSVLEALRAARVAHASVCGGRGRCSTCRIRIDAGAEHLPPPLLEQLKPGGKLVIPVGEHHGYQELLVVEVGDDGEVSRKSVLPVRFVPLTGDR